MSNLTGVLSNQSMYEQAEETHRQAFRLYETALGKGCPSCPYMISANAFNQGMNEKSHTFNILYKETGFILYVRTSQIAVNQTSFPQY
jgi:hypothetical protein